MNINFLSVRFSFSKTWILPFKCSFFLHGVLLNLPWNSYFLNHISDIVLDNTLWLIFKSATSFSNWLIFIDSASMLTTDWMKIIPTRSQHIVIECIFENFESKLFLSLSGRWPNTGIITIHLLSVMQIFFFFYKEECILSIFYYKKECIRNKRHLI